MRERGFTLLEVSVAGAVFGTIMVFSMTALVAGQRATSEAAADHVASSAIASALSVMLPEIRESGAAEAGSGMGVDGSPEGGAGQRITFRKNTGYDVEEKRIVWSESAVSFWHEAAGRRLKRREGAGAVTVIATGIEPDLSFAVADGEVTIRMRSARTLSSDGSVVVDEAVERVALRN